MRKLQNILTANTIFKENTGSALVSLVIFMPFLILIASFYLSLSANSFRLARGEQLRSHAQFATDSGIDFALREINVDDTWTGTAGEVELQNANNVRTTYDVTITDVDSDTKLVTSTGRSYTPASSTTPDKELTIEVNLRPVSTGGTLSLVTGVGGLYMSNSAKIIGGDVHVNGEIELSNTAQIGLSTNPVDLSVAHQNCPDPPGAAYPRICESGENDEPINITHSALIYGEVSANNQTDGSSMYDPGLTSSITINDWQNPPANHVETLSLPDHDRAAQINAVNSDNDMTGSEASCGGSQIRTWSANTKIEGDVNIRQGCEVTIEGDVWVTGRLTLQNSSKIIIDDSLGETIPNIMIDGSAGMLIQNSAEVQPNSNSNGGQFITYWSRASCSPGCAEVTGQDLYDTRNDRTIYLQNSASAPNTIIYARWSQAEIGNGGGIGAVVGQTVRMSNNSAITFGTSVGGGADTGGWLIDGYRRVF